MPAPSVPSTNARGVILSSHMQKFPLSVESLYDKYNRSNLLLKDCHSKDIQMLHKCIIVAEEGLGSELQQ